MLEKNTLLNTWLWKWHVIAGLLTLPVMLLLSTTGTIYLFKDDLNKAVYEKQLVSSYAVGANPNAEPLALSKQFALAESASDKKIVSITLPASAEQTTAFSLAGKGRAKNNLYVDPYNGEVLGEVDRKETLMYTVRKLHGELLLSTFGTLVVELVASWFVVLILTGLYVWWPKNGQGVGGLFLVRFNRGKRMLYRDIHAVFGFWLSVFMLIIIAGAMPWTDVFGEQLKWVQKQTDSGYPMQWRSDKGIQSTLPENSNGASLSIDQIHSIASNLSLEGQLTITLPKTPKSAYKISNTAFYTDDQEVMYLNQYTGEIIQQLTWDDVGVLMDLRQVFMRLHEGKYGLINWSVLLLVAVLFTLSTLAGLISYFTRKPRGKWGIPKVPERFHADKVLVGLILCLGVLFPMFGISVVVISLLSHTRNFISIRVKPKIE